MPLGKYPDWDSRIRAQRRLGHDKESAERICGFIEKKTKEAHAAKKRIKGNDMLP